MDMGSFAPMPYLVGVGMPVEEDVEMTHPVASGMGTFYSEGEDGSDSTC